MVGNVLASWGVTRDDWKLFWLVLASIVVGIATLGDAATGYGIPAWLLPYIRLANLIVGTVSAKMSTSSLPAGDR